MALMSIVSGRSRLEAFVAYLITSKVTYLNIESMTSIQYQLELRMSLAQHIP